MNKRSFISVIATITFIFTSHSIAFADPNSSEKQTIHENKVKYEQLDIETLELDAEIARLNNEIDVINQQLQKNTSEIQNLEIEIDNINKKIEYSKIEIDEREELMSKRLRSIYKTNMSSDILTYLITSESFVDFFHRIDAMKNILSIDKDIVSELNNKKDELTKDIEVNEDKKDNLNLLRVSIESDLEEVNKKKLEQDLILQDLNSKKDEIMAVIEKNEASLLSHTLSIINSGSSSKADLNEAISNLNSMLSQLNSSYAINLAEEGIASANNKIAEIEAASNTVNTIVTSNSSGKYLQTYSMDATAYTGGGYTAMGLKPVRDANGLSSVAVDPNVIPLGSKVYVDGYGYAIASDTGGAIKGNKIDLYMNSVDECFSFGRRTVTVHLVAYPNQW